MAILLECVLLNKPRTKREFPSWLSGKETQLVSMRTWVQSLASLSGLKIWRCHELSCRSQVRLGADDTEKVKKTSGYRYDSTPSLGPCISHRYGPKKTKKKKRKKRKKKILENYVISTFQFCSGEKQNT